MFVGYAIGFTRLEVTGMAILFDGATITVGEDIGDGEFPVDVVLTLDGTPITTDTVYLCFISLGSDFTSPNASLGDGMGGSDVTNVASLGSSSPVYLAWYDADNVATLYVGGNDDLVYFHIMLPDGNTVISDGIQLVATPPP